MTDEQRPARYQRDEEDEAERLDRHWAELLQELRLAQTGTQILFAFLLSIAFTNGSRRRTRSPTTFSPAP